MEFLASLAIKALIGTSICGAVTVGTIYKCDRTLLGFEPLTTNTNTSGEKTSDGDKGSGPQTGAVESSQNVFVENKGVVKLTNALKTDSAKANNAGDEPDTANQASSADGESVTIEDSEGQDDDKQKEVPKPEVELVVDKIGEDGTDTKNDVSVGGSEVEKVDQPEANTGSNADTTGDNVGISEGASVDVKGSNEEKDGSNKTESSDNK